MLLSEESVSSTTVTETADQSQEKKKLVFASYPSQND